ncbi:MAG TPA: hypothetical protein VJ440_09535 [Candidatus Brocadiaceae bacterium]|nr:hypothetical protein [Candidatus Brocadiaceae bacterium]
MGFTLDKVVPWGRSYEEYVSMFDLTEIDLELRVLGCGDGPAAFNSALSKRGEILRIISARIAGKGERKLPRLFQTKKPLILHFCR